VTAGQPDRHADMAWIRAEPLTTVLAALNADGIETRVVGGAVRNALMGEPRPHDIDLATTAAPEDVMARAAGAGLKCVPTGIAHGTVTVIAGGQPFEVTTLRHDVETHGRHATVAFGADWEADALRRDFTMNALYADREGWLYDPAGGLADIAARRVRFIGNPRARIMEDYLRILRFFRFHAQYGSGPPDEAGLHAAIAERHGLRRLSAERVHQEIMRLLAAPGAPATAEIMADTGILQLVLAGVAFWPSLQKLAEIESGLGHTPDTTLRLGALSVAIPEDGARLGIRLRLSNAERDRLTAMGAGWRTLSPELGENARRALLYRTGTSAWRDSALLAWARSRAPADSGEWHALVTLPDRWRPPAFPLRGTDLIALGMRHGPAIGEMLDALEQEWSAEGFAADRDTLLQRAEDRITMRQ
jgi:poly(A) polymerase